MPRHLPGFPSGWLFLLWVLAKKTCIDSDMVPAFTLNSIYSMLQEQVSSRLIHTPMVAAGMDKESSELRHTPCELIFSVKGQVVRRKRKRLSCLECKALHATCNIAAFAFI